MDRMNVKLWAMIAVGLVGVAGVSGHAGAEDAGFSQEWTMGSTAGFLSGTPDDTAFALTGNVEKFLTDQVSVGPLLQMAFTEDLFQVGVSGQAKYWIPLTTSGNRARAFVEAGLGIVHADFSDDDTSWLVPLGAGITYAVTPLVDLTSTVWLNVTDLETRRGNADVMPGVTVGVYF